MFLIPFTTTLRDGTAVLVREVRPEDRSLVEVGLDHVSRETLYFRFLASVSRLSDAQLAHFTRENTRDHIAIGAVSSGTEQLEPLGIARFVRLPDNPNAAEFAVTVVDDHQGKGLGTLLLGVLAKLACAVGVTRFFGLVHAENGAMLHLLDQLGGTVHRREGAEIGITVPLHRDSGHYPQTPAGDAFRTAYALAPVPARA